MGHSRWADTIVVEQPGRASSALLWLARRVVFPIVWLMHRPRLLGLANLPEKGPFLLVANHSAGIGLAEITSFVVLWARAFDGERRIAGYALPLGFKIFPLSLVLRAVGAIPSTYPAAARTLAEGVPILLFPGGDHEALRPIWQAGRVDFGGRLGFLRVAREARVPIVPLGIQGAHFTAPILLRSRLLATLLVVPRLIGTKRWALSVLGVLGASAIALLAPWSWPVRAALVWLWLGSPLTLVPWVWWPIRMRVGEPIECNALFSEETRGTRDGHEDELRRALARVEGAVQSLVSGD